MDQSKNIFVVIPLVKH